MMKILIILIAIAGIGAGVAIGDGIDPGALVKGLKQGDQVGTSGIDEKSNTEPRSGREVNEINLLSIDTAITPAIADKMNAAGIGGGLYNGNWVSFTNLFTKLGISDQPTKDIFQKWFVLDTNDDAEAYWADDNGDKAMGTNELYHRFNLSRDDWDDMTVDKILAGPVAADKYNAGVLAYDGGGLRWLANFGKKADGSDDESLRGTFPTVAARRKQIAANLIDYCDGKDDEGTVAKKTEVTRDSDTDPTYTGIEVTPCINEIGVYVEFTATSTMFGSTYWNDYDFSIEIIVEIANIFRGMGAISDLRDGKTQFEILEGAVYYTRQQSDGTKVSESINLARGLETLTEVRTNNYKTTYTGQFSSPSISNGTSSNKKFDATVTDVKVKIKRAWLKYNGIFADFVKPDYDADPSVTDPSDPRYLPKIDTFVTQPASPWWSVKTVKSCCFSYQANDPRQNLNDGDWAPASVSAIQPNDTAKYGRAPYGNTVGTPDAINDGVTYATEGDMEAGKTPTTLSTAYIRNGEMISPWEIGCIHRGSKWETINLKEYNRAAAINPKMGGGLYKADATGNNGGDANILDQIKMTSRVKSKQKVNLNLQTDTSTGSGVLNALFKKIRVGSAYEDSVRVIGTQKSQNDIKALPASGNVFGDKWVATDKNELYSWNGSAWKKDIKNIGDSYIDTDKKIYTWGWDGHHYTWIPWTPDGTEINTPAIVNDIKLISKDFKTRANVVKSATLINGVGGVTQDTDSKKEEIIGKMVNLTTVAPSGYFTIIIIAQSIKDVGPGTFYKDLDMDGKPCTDTSVANELTLGADINGDGEITDTTTGAKKISEKIVKTGFGKYKQYADEIMAEQKIRADVYRDPITNKCTIIKMEYLEE